MHALVVTARIEPGVQEGALEHLRANVVPQAKQAPGLVSGHWLAPRNGEGMSVLLFENEESAQQAANAIPNFPRPEGVTIGMIEVREVVAHT